jgi:glycosyltransferase involved in cell wall biosynthesis
MVPAGDHEAMAAGALRLLTDAAYAKRLSDAALKEVQKYTWQQVKHRWASVYASVRTGARIKIEPA